MGGSWAPLGPHWVPLGRSWAPLGRLLGVSWTSLGRFLGLLGASCVILDALGGFGEGIGRVRGGVWRLLSLLDHF